MRPTTNKLKYVYLYGNIFFVPVFVITVLYVYCYYVCYFCMFWSTHLQRTEKVPIELDISAIEEYVIIILLIKEGLKSIVTLSLPIL